MSLIIYPSNKCQAIDLSTLKRRDISAAEREMMELEKNADDIIFKKKIVIAFRKTFAFFGRNIISTRRLVFHLMTSGHRSSDTHRLP